MCADLPGRSASSRAHAPRTPPSVRTSSGSPLTAPMLVGRARELQLISAALNRRPFVVWLEGEAGIGKSRLLEAVLAQDGHGGRRRALLARCPPVRRPPTLGSLADALRHQLPRPPQLPPGPLTAALRPLFPEWSELLPGDLEPLEDSTAARHRAFRALADLIARLRADTLVVEDVHWADEATIEFLLFVASGGGQPLPIVVTSRPEDLPMGSLLPRLSRLAAGRTGMRISLGPLDVSDTARLVSSMADGVAVSDEFAALIHDSTDGVPLAIEETMRLLADKGLVAQRNGQWIRRSLRELPLPRTIRDVVLERVASLGADAQRVLQAAAVISDPASESLLAAVSGLPPDSVMEALVEGLRRGGLLTAHPAGQTSFSHVLAARAIYEETPDPIRRRMHLRAAHALMRAGASDVTLSHHFREAGDVESWHRHGERAVDLANSTGDTATAAGLIYDLVAGRRLDVHDMMRLVDKFSFASCPRADWCDELIATLRSYLEHGHAPPETHPELHCRLGHALGAVCDYGASRRELEIAARTLGDRPELAAKTMGLLGWPTGHLVPIEEHLQWIRRAAELRPRLGARDQRNLDIDTASALLMLGQTEGWDLVEEFAPSADLDAHDPALQRVDVARAQLNVADSLVLWGRFDEAGRRFDKALQLCDEGELVRLRDIVLTERLELDWCTGSWDGLRARAEALAASEDLARGTRLDAARVAGHLARASGANERAHQHFEQAISGCYTFGWELMMARPAAGHAQLHLDEGNVSAAVDLMRAVYSIVEKRNAWIWASEMIIVHTRALLAAGSVSEARDTVAAYTTGVAGLPAPAHQVALTTCHAILAEADDAREDAYALYGRAAVEWEEMPRLYVALLARECLAVAALRAGHEEEGIATLRDSMAGLTRMGARHDVGRIAGRLRDLGVDTRANPASGGRVSYGDHLSPREREVVRLVIEGRTNQEIAAQLSRSPHTVGTQLRSAMRKLNVSRRAALAARVLEDGLLDDGSAVGR